MSNSRYSLAKKILNKVRSVVGKKTKLLHKHIYPGEMRKKYLVECVNSSYISSSGGKFIKIFEKKIKNFTKSKYVISVINATSDLQGDGITSCET